MDNRGIYNNGAYLIKHPNWHLEGSSTKAKWIKSVIPEEIRSSVRSILEIGCGRGAILNGLKGFFNKECQFTGIDISNEAISYARNNFKDIIFICGDVYSLDLDRTQYDLVLCIDVLEHLYYQEEFLKIINQLSRHSLFHVPIGNNLKNKLFNRWENQMNKFGHMQFYDIASLINTFTNCGLKIRAYKHTFGLEYPKYKHIYPFLKWAFKISPYITSQTIGLVSVMILAESLPKTPFNNIGEDYNT